MKTSLSHYMEFLVSGRDNRFTSYFWKNFQIAVETRVNLSITYHAKTKGQNERTIQTLDYMLGACAINIVEIGISIYH